MPNFTAQIKNTLYDLCVSTAQLCETKLQTKVVIEDF